MMELSYSVVVIDIASIAVHFVSEY